MLCCLSDRLIPNNQLCIMKLLKARSVAHLQDQYWNSRLGKYQLNEFKLLIPLQASYARTLRTWLIHIGSKTLAVSGTRKDINQVRNKFLLRPSSNVPRCSSLRNSLHCKMLRVWVDYAEKAWASQSVMQSSHAEELSFYTHLHCAGTFILGGNCSCLFSAPIHIPSN